MSGLKTKFTRPVWCHVEICLSTCVQVLIDIGVDPELLPRMETVVREHLEANPLDFTGECSVHANVGADPMKLAVTIWWSYCYNGEPTHLNNEPNPLGHPASPNVRMQCNMPIYR